MKLVVIITKILFNQLLFLVCFTDYVKATDLECDFKEYSTAGYTCLVLTRTVHDHDPLTISGQHLMDKNDEDVKNMHILTATIKRVPNEIFQRFPKLEKLNVQVQKLEVIDQNSFKGASSLKEFWARGNRVERLVADSFFGADNLTAISLSSNIIEFVDENAFRTLTKLEKLILGQNFITKLLRDTFKDLTGLLQISLHSNMIEEIPEGLFSNNLVLQKVALQNNRIKIIPLDLFINLNHLKNLELKWNICISQTFNNDFTSLTEEITKCSKSNTMEAKFQQMSIQSAELNSTITKDKSKCQNIIIDKHIELANLQKIATDLQLENDKLTKNFDDCQQNRTSGGEVKKGWKFW